MQSRTAAFGYNSYNDCLPVRRTWLGNQWPVLYLNHDELCLSKHLFLMDPKESTHRRLPVFIEICLKYGTFLK